MRICSPASPVESPPGRSCPKPSLGGHAGFLHRPRSLFCKAHAQDFFPISRWGFLDFEVPHWPLRDQADDPPHWMGWFLVRLGLPAIICRHSWRAHLLLLPCSIPLRIPLAFVRLFETMQRNSGAVSCAGGPIFPLLHDRPPCGWLVLRLTSASISTSEQAARR